MNIYHVHDEYDKCIKVLGKGSKARDEYSKVARFDIYHIHMNMMNVVEGGDPKGGAMVVCGTILVFRWVGVRERGKHSMG